MGWQDYYNILKEHGSFDKAPKEKLKIADDKMNDKKSTDDEQVARRVAQEKYDQERIPENATKMKDNTI